MRFYSLLIATLSLVDFKLRNIKYVFWGSGSSTLNSSLQRKKEVKPYQSVIDLIFDWNLAFFFFFYKKKQQQLWKYNECSLLLSSGGLLCIWGKVISLGLLGHRLLRCVFWSMLVWAGAISKHAENSQNKLVSACSLGGLPGHIKRVGKHLFFVNLLDRIGGL